MGTPKLVPRQGGCALNSSCAHLCAQACPVGAIQRIQPDTMKIGLAHVERHLCLAWDQEVKCLVCVEACTWEAALPFHGRVTVDPVKCVGCGRCENACPVAGSAIQVRPVVQG
jgi:formate hydrogenlyase subunit 6/NADH:ubiquinone oxidoreductase subunit I